MKKEKFCTLRIGSQGFTLLELLVVLMLVGVSSLLVLPAMGRRLDRKSVV